MKVTQVTDIKSAFEPAVPDSVQGMSLEMTNLNGIFFFLSRGGMSWMKPHLHVYFGGPHPSKIHR